MGTPGTLRPYIREICDRYRAGESSLRIAASLGASQPSVSRVIKAHRLTRSHMQAMRKYACNRTYFQSIDTEPQAYWLGFLAADGHIDLKQYIVSLSLAAQDREHVERFRDALESNHPLQEIKAPRTFKNSQPQVKFQITSYTMSHNLDAWGLVKQKTYNLRWPQRLHPDLWPHFFRGFFDGDGCVSFHPKTPSLTNVSFVSCIDFLSDMKRYLMAACGFSDVKINQSPKYHHAIGKLSFGGRRQVESLYSLMYSNATIWLPRKREKFEKGLLAAQATARRQYTQDEIVYVCSAYLAGRPSTDLAKWLRVHPTVLRALLRREGIEIRSSGESFKIARSLRNHRPRQHVR